MPYPYTLVPFPPRKYASHTILFSHVSHLYLHALLPLIYTYRVATTPFHASTPFGRGREHYLGGEEVERNSLPCACPSVNKICFGRNTTTHTPFPLHTHTFLPGRRGTPPGSALHLTDPTLHALHLLHLFWHDLENIYHLESVGPFQNYITSLPKTWEPFPCPLPPFHPPHMGFLALCAFLMPASFLSSFAAGHLHASFLHCTCCWGGNITP